MRALVLSILITAVCPCQAQEIYTEDPPMNVWLAKTKRDLIGTCTSVIDGDTFLFKNNQNLERTIELQRIDAPELDQTFGIEARQRLAELLSARTITVSIRAIKPGKDPGFAIVSIDGVHVDEILVREGFAWSATRESNEYQSNSGELDHLENDARAAGLGLWAYSKPCRPNTWRNSLRPIETTSGGFAFRIVECGAIPPPARVNRSGILEPDPFDPESGFRLGSEMEILIDEHGEVEVEAIGIEGTPPWVHQASLKVVREWKFSPTYLDGEPIKTLMLVRVAVKKDEER